jgi:hypothetical protein
VLLDELRALAERHRRHLDTHHVVGIAGDEAEALPQGVHAEQVRLLGSRRIEAHAMQQGKALFQPCPDRQRPLERRHCVLHLGERRHAGREHARLAAARSRSDERVEVEVAGSDLHRVERGQHRSERIEVESRSHEQAAARLHAPGDVLVHRHRQLEARQLLHALGLVGRHQALGVDELVLDDVRAAIERALRQRERRRGVALVVVADLGDQRRRAPQVEVADPQAGLPSSRCACSTRVAPTRRNPQRS